MLFNSIGFAIFLPLVFIGYWFLFQRNLKLQNIFITLVSYLFYGWWDWRFLLLIAFTSFCSYMSGIQIERYRNLSLNVNISKMISVGNIMLNLAILGFFKYYNFFVDSFISAFSSIGVELHPHALQIILPVGISFYTFQALSYSIDVYRKKIEPTHDIVSFFAFVSFFPQLVAGPIERATHLLPQFYKKRIFNYDIAIKGTVLIAYGLFKKMVIADRLAVYVNVVFDNEVSMNSWSYLLGMFFFSWQIYCDFSGYSDIARGVARLFGFELTLNFDKPYFSTSFHQFWRRWHISLSTWFRDYLYIPLGGNRDGEFNTYRNLILVFVVSGFWHGANWTFIVWGVMHGLFQTVENLSKVYLLSHFKRASQLLRGTLASKVVSWGIVYFFVCIAWIVFRADSISDAFQMIDHIFSNNYTLNTMQICVGKGFVNLGLSLFVVGLLIMTDLFIDKVEQHPNNWTQILFVSILFTITFILGQDGEAQFIYFQF